MKFFKWKETLRNSFFLERLDMFMLGISSENQRKLIKAKEENNIFLYNDILFHALVHDDKQSWWHTDIWTLMQDR